MAAAASPSYVSYEDYLALEASSDEKHEWCDGVVYAMSRGTPEHGRLTASIARVLGNAVLGECRVYAADTMIWIERVGISTYADASMVCGPLETKTVRSKTGQSLGEAIINPSVIVEVLSDSTERYDRDGKFQAYKQLPSLQEYVIVNQNERKLEVYRLAKAEWLCETAGPGGTVSVRGKPITVDSVYE